MATPDELILAQAPIVRPDPIPRPEPVERPGSRRPNRFQKYVQPEGEAPAEPAKPVNRFEKYVTQDTADPAAPQPQRPLNFGQPSQQGINAPQSLNEDVIRQALEKAPPDVRERALREWAATKPDDPMMPDVLKSFGVGVVKGGVGLATLPDTMAKLVDAGGDYLGAPEWLKSTVKAPFQVRDKLFQKGAELVGGPAVPLSNEAAIGAIEKQTGPLYKPKTLPGEYAQTVGEFVPGGLTPAGMGRRVANVVAPALVSETGGQIFKGTDLETPARIAGGVLGGTLPNAAARLRTPFPNPSPERARMVQVLEREGIDLTAGDRTGSKPLRWAESAANDVPLSGHRIGATKEMQGEQFTRAVLRRAGIDAPRATDDVIDGAFRRLGAEFDTFAQYAAVPVTPQLSGRINNIARQYERVTEPSLVNPLVRSIADDISQIYQTNNRSIMPAMLDARRYSAWRSDIGAAARATSDPRTERALYDMQRLLDDAAEASLRQRGGFRFNGLADRMREARREYRNLLTIAKARGAGEDAAVGIINPRQLQQAAKQMEGWQGYSRGRGDFTELARAGNAVLAPLPNSGTPARLAAQGLFTTLGTVGGALSGGPVGAIAGGIGSHLAQGTGARLLMSQPVQSYLGRRTLQAAQQQSQARQSPLIPALLAAQSGR